MLIFDGKNALDGVKNIPTNQIPDQKYLENYCGGMIEAIG